MSQIPLIVFFALQIAVCPVVLVVDARLRRRLAVAEYEARHDRDTGLLNRRGFLEVAASYADAGPLSAALLDVDRFKAVNSATGILGGDALLQQIARRLSRLSGPVLALARFGGDEFVLLMPGDPDTVLATAKEAWRAIAEPHFHLFGHELPITLSIGVATAAEGDSFRRLLRGADLALGAAKQTGQGVYVLPYGLPDEPIEDRPLQRPRDQRKQP